MGTSLGDTDLQTGAYWRCLCLCARCGRDVLQGLSGRGQRWQLLAGFGMNLGGSRMEEGIAQSDGILHAADLPLGRWTGYLPVLTLPKPRNQQEHAEYHEVLPYCFWPIQQYLTLTTCKSKKKVHKESTKHKIMHLHLCCLT